MSENFTTLKLGRVQYLRLCIQFDLKDWWVKQPFVLSAENCRKKWIMDKKCWLMNKHKRKNQIRWFCTKISKPCQNKGLSAERLGQRRPARFQPKHLIQPSHSTPAASYPKELAYKGISGFRQVPFLPIVFF